MSKEMQIKRVYKETSLKHGKEEVVDEAKVREIANQADTYRIDPILKQRHLVGESSSAGEVIRHLKNGETIDTYFSTFSMIKEPATV